MVGMSIARSTRSGTWLGPGICKKCRPVWTAAFDMLKLPSAILHAEFCDCRNLLIVFRFFFATRQSRLNKKSELRLLQFIKNYSLQPGSRIPDLSFANNSRFFAPSSAEALKVSASEELVELLEIDDG
jgi:hypothetical protein